MTAVFAGSKGDVDKNGFAIMSEVTPIAPSQAFHSRDAEKEASDHHGSSQISIQQNTPSKTESRYTWRFWAIIVSLCVTGLLSAVEGTVPSTALPSIIKDLEGGNLYIWVVNGYFLTR